MHCYNPYAYLRRKLGIPEVTAGIADLRDLITNLPEKIVMALRPEIQAVVDAITALGPPLAALEAAQTDEMAKIKELTDKVNAGGQLTDEEKAALSGAVSTVQTLTANVIAATPAPAVVAAVGG